MIIRAHIRFKLMLIAVLLLSMLSGMVYATEPKTDPIIGEDHPTKAGEVMLFKESKPVEGFVNTWEVTLRVEAKDTVQTSDTILVIDTSGSMYNNGRLIAAKEAANTLIEALLPAPTPANPLNRVAVINFDYYAEQAIGFTNNQAEAKSAVNGLSANGGTFTQAGVNMAANLMNESHADHKNIILLSDGQPTYSYAIKEDWRMNTGNLIPRSPGWWTPDDVPANQFIYNTNNRVGNGTSIEQRYDDVWGSQNDKYYHHGNSAIAEAGFAKGSSTLYTIALEAGDTGTPILKAMATEGKAYTATPKDLNDIFAEIAGQINAAVQKAVVEDPMGTGFEVNGDVEDIRVTHGTFTYEDNKINWTIGTVSDPLPNPDNDPDLANIKYAEMVYQVTINDDILDATGTGGQFNTNGGASLTYTYINDEGEEQTNTLYFPQPTEDPVLLIMEKVLVDSLGNKVSTSSAGTDSRQFQFHVTGKTTDAAEVYGEL